MPLAPSSVVVRSICGESGRGAPDLSVLDPSDIVVVLGGDGRRVADLAHEIAVQVGCRSAAFVSAGTPDEAAAGLAAFCLEQFGVAPVSVPSR